MSLPKLLIFIATIVLGLLLSAAILTIRWLPPSDEVYWRRAVEQKPDSKSYWFYGQALRKVGKLDEAEKAYRQCLTISPNDEGCKYWLGITLYDKGETRTANQLWQELKQKSLSSRIPNSSWNHKLDETIRTHPSN